MTLKTTRWTLDTCGCVVEHTWDTDINPPINTPSAVINKCSFHASVPDELLYVTVLAENNRKEWAFEEALSVRSTLVRDNYEWSFDENRNLVVRFAGMTSAQRNSLQNALNLRIGIGKVTVTA